MARGAIQGAAGGAIFGALLGITEALYLLSASGAPDLLSPFYATLLYGLLGLMFGLGGGLVLGLAMYRGPLVNRLSAFDDAVLFVWGGVVAVTPMSLFILRYIVNKVVYAERGVPMAVMVGILGAVFVGDLLLVAIGARLARGPMSFVLKAPGFLAAWALLAGASYGGTYLDTGEDPRAAWAHGREVPEALAERPNVLYIMVDTLRADYLGAYGKEDADTPVIDALAADSVVFERGFAQASWTRASGASQFASRLPSGHNAALKAARLPDEVVIWPEVLQDAGVTTGALINNINLTGTFNFDQGYDTFIYEAPEYVFGATESVFGLTMYKVVHKLHEKINKQKYVGHFYQPAEVVLEDAKGFIEDNKDSRWSLFVHLMEPHDPYFEHPNIDGSGSDEYNGTGFARAEVEHPDPSLADYLKGVYEDEITFMDRRLTPFVEWLKSSGHYDNTLIVFTADHGEEFFEHKGWWHGTTLYDEQIHVPMMVKLPEQDLAGTRVPWQVRSIDLAPTITTALGLEAPDEWEGSDLIEDVRTHLAEQEALRIEEAKAAATKAAATALMSLDLSIKAVKPEAEDDRAKEDDPCARYEHGRDRIVIAEEDFEGNVLSAIRTTGFKLVIANEGNPRGLPPVALYDEVADPGEMENVAEEGSQRCGIYPSDKVGSLQPIMDAAISASQAGAVEADQSELSDAERAALEALGYLDVAE
jgi:arylsulfatase A-like enzyme